MAPIKEQTCGGPGQHHARTLTWARVGLLQIYLTTLEAARSGSSNMASQLCSTEAQAAGLANFVAGATASCVTQTIVVPIDVVSQRQMIAEGSRSSAPQVCRDSASPSIPWISLGVGRPSI